MNRIEWYFPETIDEAAALLARERTVPHGGGTGLVKSGLSSFSGVVDLAKLPLNYLKMEKGILEIGASQTFASVAENLSNLCPDCILVAALGSAASTPLRNRITIGGSVSFFPPWSDLIGPFSVLEGEICTEGKNSGTYDLSSWLANRPVQQGTLVTSVLLPDAADWDSCYYREVRVGFDYPAFTVSVVARKNGSKIEKVRAAVSGGLERVTRLSGIEDGLNGKDLSQLASLDVKKMARVTFGRKPAGSAENLSEIAAVHVERCLKSVLLGGGELR